VNLLNSGVDLWICLAEWDQGTVLSLDFYQRDLQSSLTTLVTCQAIPMLLLEACMFMSCHKYNSSVPRKSKSQNKLSYGVMVCVLCVK
jgi:hypothetical protein